MKKFPYISGLTFIKNGLTLGYPIKESIESIETICDEVIINVGFDDPNLQKDDGTYQYLRDHFTQQKYKFLKSYWNPHSTQHGLILSEQTNIALSKCHGQFCQYIQGDEVIHEDDLAIILDGVERMEKNSQIQGLVFDYLHFYGNIDIVKHTRNIYRREVRLIRNHLNVRSWLDAQGFRHENKKKLNCIRIPARIFHYGWSRKTQVMNKKIKIMEKFYHGEEREKKENHFEYCKIWGLKRFLQTHPKYMGDWIAKNKNELDILALKYQFEAKDIGLMLSDLIESLWGYRIGEYKNYKLIKE